MLHRLLTVSAACVLVALPHATLRAQDPASAAARVKTYFRAFDLNEDGWLSGKEVAACDCRAYDSDGNAEITWEEFLAGYARAPLFGGGTAAAPRTPPAAPVPAAPVPAAQTPYQIGQMVEVNVDGTWYKASIVGIQNGRYALSRHDRSYGVTTDNEWVPAERLRPFVAKPTVAPKVAGLPASVPTGTYDCVLYGVGGNVGQLRIVGDGISSGITRDGSGGTHRFSYDASTGAMSWPGGMTIVGFTVEQAFYRPETTGRPNINLHYRRSAGGNLNSMYCTRH